MSPTATAEATTSAVAYAVRSTVIAGPIPRGRPKGSTARAAGGTSGRRRPAPARPPGRTARGRTATCHRRSPRPGRAAGAPRRQARGRKGRAGRSRPDHHREDDPPAPDPRDHPLGVALATGLDPVHRPAQQANGQHGEQVEQRERPDSGEKAYREEQRQPGADGEADRDRDPVECDRRVDTGRWR